MSKFRVTQELVAKQYGNPEYQKQLIQMERLSRKWSKWGYLEGIEDSTVKRNVATLLQNQGVQVLREQNLTGKHGAHEQWSGIALPLIRRIFATLLANEIMSVQPMNAPTGLVFTLDFTWANDRPGFSKGDSIYGLPFDENETWKDRYPYGEGLFNYTKNQFETLVPATSEGITVRLAKLEDVRFDSEITIPTVKDVPEGADPDLYNPYRVISIPTTVTNTTNKSLKDLLIDPNAIRSFIIEHDDIREIFPGYFKATPDPTDTNWPPKLAILNFVVKVGDDFYESDIGESAESTDVDIPFESGNFKLTYVIQTFDEMRGDFEAGMQGKSPGSGDKVTDGAEISFDTYAPTPEIPEVNIKLTSQMIGAITKKLKATFSPEIEEDIRSYSNLDVEEQLTKVMTGIIGLEIDREMIDMLLQNSYGSVERWSTIPSEIWRKETGRFEAVPNLHRGSLNEWYMTLVNKIQKVSNMIHKKTLRAGATFLIVSPEVATVIESIPGFSPDTDGAKSVFNMGTEKVGTINKRWTVYKYPDMDTNRILVGYKGDSIYDAGAVYAPYIPIITTPLFPDPSTLVRIFGMHTRYAKQMLRPEFYGNIIVKGLENV